MSPGKEDSAQERRAVADEKAASCAWGGCGTVIVIVAFGVILTNLFGGSPSGGVVLVWLVFLLVGVVALIGGFVSRSK